MSDSRSKRGLSIKIGTLIFLGMMAYIHGVRFITLEEVPSSHRPWQLYLSAAYASEHLREVDAQNPDWLSQISR